MKEKMKEKIKRPRENEEIEMKRDERKDVLVVSKNV